MLDNVSQWRGPARRRLMRAPFCDKIKPFTAGKAWTFPVCTFGAAASAVRRANTLNRSLMNAPLTAAATQRALFSPQVPALLALADGTVFRGRSIGALGRAIGEVVFNTAMTGYEEILTDPSYAGQIVTLTCSHIG